MVKTDTAIIGGGPAGLGAAIYTARGNLKTLVFEKALVGGQIVLTSEVENYPGFEESVSGFEIVDKMKKQAERFGTEFVEEQVKDIKTDGKRKIIKTEENEFDAKTVILATGAKPRKLNVKGEKKLTGRGVSYCATCDGALYRDKIVAVVGGGDAAVEEALFLTKFAKKVYIIHRRDKLRAVKIAQERAFANDKIEVIWDSVIKEIKGDNAVKSVQLYNKKKQEDFELEIDGIFIYIGIIPNNKLAKQLGIKLSPSGFIEVDGNMQTNKPGIYAAGDILEKGLKQVVTAASDGATAAVAADKWIEENFS